MALDYCVTYEVSPPSWESARCEYKPLQADGSYVAGHTIVGEAFRDSLSSGMSWVTATRSSPDELADVEHRRRWSSPGQILGDVDRSARQARRRSWRGADVMVISCARLIRIDFIAAGDLLNWVHGARRRKAAQVQFVDVHRLVAAFFNVIGISEHARRSMVARPI